VTRLKKKHGNFQRQVEKTFLNSMKELNEFIIYELLKQPQITDLITGVVGSSSSSSWNKSRFFLQELLFYHADIILIRAFFEYILKNGSNERKVFHVSLIKPTNLEEDAAFSKIQQSFSDFEHAKIKELLLRKMEVQFSSYKEFIKPTFLSLYLENSLKYKRLLTWNDSLSVVVKFVYVKSLKKGKGVYYTSPEICEKMIYLSLKPLCETKILNPLRELISKQSKLDSQEIKSRLSSIMNHLLQLKILDPSMGTGNFLIAAFNFLGGLHEVIVNELKKIDVEIVNEVLRSEKANFLMDGTPNNFSLWQEHILTHVLHGLDIDPKATLIAKMLLFLEFVNSFKASDDLFWKLDLNFLTRNALVSPINFHDEDAGRHFRSCQKQMVSILNIREKLRQITDVSEILSLTEKKKLIETQLRDGFIQEMLTSEILRQDDLQKFMPVIWQLDFPEIFFLKDGTLKHASRQGFDLVIGNPPWEKWKGQKHEWGELFASTSLYKTGNTAEVVSELLKKDELRQDFEDYKGHYRRVARFLKARFSLTSRGDQNLYKIFLELFLILTKKDGIFSIICPADVLSNKGTDILRSHLLKNVNISSLLEIISGKEFFPQIHDNISVMILTVRKGNPTKFIYTRTKISTKDGLLDVDDDLVRKKLKQNIKMGKNPPHISYFSASIIENHTPKTNSIPLFDSSRSVSVTRKMFRYPKLGDKEWGCKTSSGFHMTKARRNRWIIRQKTRIPVIKGENLVRFGHNNKIKWWVQEEKEKNLTFWGQDYIGWKNVTGNDSRRRMRVVLFKANTVAVGNCINVIYNFPLGSGKYLCAMMNSLPFEFRLRQICLGNNINNYIMEEMPVPLHDPSNLIHRAIESWYDDFHPMSMDWARLHGNTRSSIKKSNLELRYIQYSSQLDALSAMAYDLDQEDLNTVLAAHDKLWNDYKKLVIQNFKDFKAKFSKE